MTNMINNYKESDSIDDVVRIMNTMKFHILNLNISSFNYKFNFNLIIQIFTNLAELEIKYSPNLKDENKISAYKKTIMRIF